MQQHPVHMQSVGTPPSGRLRRLVGTLPAFVCWWRQIFFSLSLPSYCVAEVVVLTWLRWWGVSQLWVTYEISWVYRWMQIPIVRCSVCVCALVYVVMYVRVYVRVYERVCVCPCKREWLLGWVCCVGCFLCRKYITCWQIQEPIYHRSFSLIRERSCSWPLPRAHSRARIIGLTSSHVCDGAGKYTSGTGVCVYMYISVHMLDGEHWLTTQFVVVIQKRRTRVFITLWVEWVCCRSECV